MNEQRFELKKRATALRRRGRSITNIEKVLSIRRSTLSYWFRDLKLTVRQQEQLSRNRARAVEKNRELAIIWHRKDREERTQKAHDGAVEVIEAADLRDTILLEIALAVLYRSEGFKKTVGIGLGNSEPIILRFFLTALMKVYDFDLLKVKCDLFLRADQNPSTEKRYWSTELGVPLSSFKSVMVDKRTVGSKTYPGYHGVCAVRCGSVDIQRKLLSLSELFFKKIIELV